MKHLGDITKINGAAVTPVNVICGGSPCQDLSIAGKRAGLAGERSGLFMEQIRIIKEMRANERKLHSDWPVELIRPRYMVWENVVGAFSSNNGEDFRAVLEETVRIIDPCAVIPRPENGRWSYAGCIMGDGYSVAWRTHDAQYWGVPQRRRRISLVADFAGSTAPEILFECESVSGNTEQGEQTRQGTSDNSERSIGETSKCLNGWDVQSKHVQPEDGIAEALYSGECRHGGGESYVLQNQSVVCIQGNAIDRQPQNGPNGKGVIEDVSFTLNTIDRHAVAYKETGHPTNAEQRQGGKETNIHDTPIVYRKQNFAGSYVEGCEAIRASGGDYGGGSESLVVFGVSGYNSNAAKIINPKIGNIVRRLTPKECERLQGFPDDWTNIGDWVANDGKTRKCTDANRYKALGNSLALPFWAWMAERMAKHLPEGATMASLFDGIGGFPLVYQVAGVKAVWASEIEEFPIAVTKLRFPEEGETR